MFNRNGTKIKLTPAGETSLQHTDAPFSIYRNLEFEMNTLTKSHNGKLRIGASTTVAQGVVLWVLISAAALWAVIGLAR